VAKRQKSKNPFAEHALYLSVKAPTVFKSAHTSSKVVVEPIKRLQSRRFQHGQ
jgi:hypothetical protein